MQSDNMKCGMQQAPARSLLNALGFLCGTPDGICGRQTVSCIERFQTMYGFEPADGLIDDELLGQMQEMLNRQGA